jgi:hypothetical protein
VKLGPPDTLIGRIEPIMGCAAGELFISASRQKLHTETARANGAHR